jgi:predicted HTH transcriptional regulator
MQADEIGLLLKQERGQFLEFISAFEYRRSSGQKKREEELARELVRVLSGMANADGGTVLVGVEPEKCPAFPIPGGAADVDSSAAEPLRPSSSCLQKDCPAICSCCSFEVASARDSPHR